MAVPHRYQSNILIGDRGEAILSDYGLSCVLEMSGFTTKMQSATWRYTAPELLLASEDGGYSPRVTKATDLWSLSMTIIEVRKSASISHKL